MGLLSIIDNQSARASDVLSTLLDRCRACPVDIATAEFPSAENRRPSRATT